MAKNKLIITVDKKTAEKDTQLMLKKSDLKRSEDVDRIKKEIQNDEKNMDLWIDLATALSKQMLYRESIQVISTALTYEPLNWKLIKYRAGKYLGLHRIEEAASQFELASRIQTSDWNILYHLGLSYYLCGRFERALKVYKECLDVTVKSDINLVAIVNWMYLTMMRLGMIDDAKQVLELVDENTEAGENQPYKDIVLAYKRTISDKEAMTFDNEGFEEIEFATRGYGIAMMYYFNGDVENSKKMMNEICSKDKFWNAFGYIAARKEIDEKRLKF